MTEFYFHNARLNGQTVALPKTLYKYRPFDEYAFDILENEYLFLCKAEKLDDPSECRATLRLEDFYDVKTGQFSSRVVDGILDYLRPYCSESSYEEVRNLVYRTMTSDGYIRRNYLLEVNFAMQELAPGVDIAPFINFLGNIPEKMQEPEMGKNIEKLLFLAYNARQEMGICSLSELSDSPKMWEKYANHSTGYCVEYSMDGYDYQSDIFPVVYTDERNTDIFSAILGGFLGKFISGMTNGQMDADKSQYIRLFLTKNTIWQYQKEWRIIGNANEKIKAPKISAIHIGKNILRENRIIMEQFCIPRNIDLIQN